MDLTLSESEQAFQAEAREWLAANVPAEPAWYSSNTFWSAPASVATDRIVGRAAAWATGDASGEASPAPACRSASSSWGAGRPPSARPHTQDP